MSVNLCIHVYVVGAADGPGVVELSRVEQAASDAFFARTGDEKTWERAGEALARAAREGALAEHEFRLPHGDAIYIEVADRLRQVAGLPLQLHGALDPKEVCDARDALARTRAVGEDAVIASLPECRRRPETARRFFAFLGIALDACGDNGYLVILQHDGVWDDAPTGEPIDERPTTADGDLDESLARIDRAASEGRVSAADQDALRRALRNAGHRASVENLLDVAEALAVIEEKLSKN